MMIPGERTEVTEQLDIFCCITGFMSDFLSYIFVEHIRFFHGALQLIRVCGVYCMCGIVLQFKWVELKLQMEVILKL